MPLPSLTRTRTNNSSGMAPLSRTISHGASVLQHPLNPDDAPTFPQFTERGPATTAYQTETATGLVDAEEAEGAIPALAASSSTSTAVGQAEKGGKRDATLVTWLQDDPENPRNKSILFKWTQTLLATLLCFVSGIASSIVTGALTPVKKTFNTSDEIVALTVAMFVVGFGIGPLFFAPLSEMYGRRPIYLISMGLFVIFTIPCAVAKSKAVLIVFRLISGTMASAPMTNAAGTIADVWSINQRGGKMAMFSSVLFAAPCFGPPIGGYIAMYTTWRWVYGVILIFSGTSWFLCLLFMRETYAPTLLRRRAAKLRKETGDKDIMTEQERFRRPLSEILSEALLRPLVMLFTEPTMTLFSGYLCLIYGLLYGFFFAIPIVMVGGHGFNDGQTGLVFFAILIGIGILYFVFCPLQERYYQKQVIKHNGVAPPEARLPLMMICSVLLPASLFIFSWTSMPYVSWVGPTIACIPFGITLVGIYISANTYLVEVYSEYAASAMAAKTFIRSLAGASVPLWISYLYKGAGNPWAGSVFAFVSVGMMPIPFAFYKYGARIRQRSKMATH